MAIKAFHVSRTAELQRYDLGTSEHSHNKVRQRESNQSQTDWKDHFSDFHYHVGSDSNQLLHNK